jgi:hypothetical protein
VHAPKLRTQKFTFYASTSNDSTLVSRGGGVKKITKQLAAGEWRKIKRQAQELFCEAAPREAKARGAVLPRQGLRLTATDEFGQTATDTLPVARVPY